MNIPLLRKVQAHILAYPEQLDMRGWVSWCGATACICGHAAILSGSDVDRSTPYEFGESGAAALNLPMSSGLFHHWHWPNDLYGAYADARDSEARARAASDAIDRFISLPEVFGT